MVKWVQRVHESIRLKLIVLFIFLILIITIPIGAVNYLKTSTMMEDNLGNYSLQILEQANLNIDRYFSEYDQAFLMIASSDEFSNWLKLKNRYHADYIREYYRIAENYVQPFVSQHPEVLSIVLLNHYGNELHYNHKSSFKLGYSMFDNMAMFKQVEFGKTEVFVLKNEDYDNHEIFTLTLLKKYVFNGQEAYLKMDISISPLLSILENNSMNQHGARFIVSSDGTIVAHSEEKFLLTPLAESYLSGMDGKLSGVFLNKEQQEFIVFASIPYYPDWKSVVAIPYQEAVKPIDEIRNVTITITLIGICLAVVLVVFISSSITSRLIKLKKQMVLTHTHQINREIHVKGNDEVAQLGHAFKRMLFRLEQSVDQLTEAKLKEQEAVFTSLQSQINSHFLYNTLEAINSMANLANMRNIETAVTSLSDMLRYTSKFKEIAVQVEDELRHVRHYLNIIRIRYDAVSCNIVMNDSKLARNICPKAILQPIIENCVKHVTEKLGLPVHMEVKMAKWGNRYLVIKIQDDGPGFHQEAIAAFQKTDPGLHIGLSNVADRIKKFYEKIGLNSRMSIRNNKHGRGAVVVLILPVIEADLNGGTGK